MRNVGERPGMNEGRLLFERLQQVWHDGIPHQDGHRARDAQIFRGDGPGVAHTVIHAHHNAPNARAHIFKARRQRENRHNLTGDSDIKAGLTRWAIFLRPQAHDDAAQRAVVHIHNAIPGDRVGIDVQFLQSQLLEIRVTPTALMVDARVNRGSTEIVRHTDGMDVTGEMQVELFHRHDLTIATAGRATLDAESRPHRGLADSGDAFIADVAQRLRQPDGGRRLALTQGGGRDRRHVDVFSVGAILELLANVQMYLRFQLAIHLQIVLGEANRLSNLQNRTQLGCLRDLNIGRNRFNSFYRHILDLL